MNCSVQHYNDTRDGLHSQKDQELRRYSMPFLHSKRSSPLDYDNDRKGEIAMPKQATFPHIVIPNDDVRHHRNRCLCHGSYRDQLF